MSRNLPVVSDKKSLSGLSPLQQYLREISKYPLMSVEEEFEYAKKFYEEGDREAARRLVTANLRLVVKIANELNRAQSTILDLIQEGNTGLMQAVKKYNPYKGVKLSSYAAWWIRAYILKYLMDNKSLVKIGTTAAQRKLFYNLKKEADRLIDEYEHIDVKLLAQKLDVREKDVIEMQKRLAAPDVSLDAPLGSDGSDEMSNQPLIGSLLKDSSESVENELSSRQIATIFGEQLEEFTKTLKGRDLEIFQIRLLSDNPVTLQDVGDRYGITRERARQIESRIIQKLKDFIKEKGVIELD
jgi:RNA polymerase sigma-32 factor